MTKNQIISSIQIVLLLLSMTGLCVATLCATDPKQYATAVATQIVVCFITVLLQQFKK